MAEAWSRIESLSLSPGLAGRTRFLPRTDRSIITTIQQGVFFVMAFWSGPARKAFAELKLVLETADPDGRLELVVVDTDGCPDLHALPEFAGKLHGAGEAAWVLRGEILRTTGLGYHPEYFEPYTRALLGAAVAPPRAGDI